MPSCGGFECICFVGMGTDDDLDSSFGTITRSGAEFEGPETEFDELT